MGSSPSGAISITAPESATGCKRSKTFAARIASSEAFATEAKTKVVGSLLLGLYDADGLLHHVGFTSGIAAVTARP